MNDMKCKNYRRSDRVSVYGATMFPSGMCATGAYDVCEASTDFDPDATVVCDACTHVCRFAEYGGGWEA